MKLNLQSSKVHPADLYDRLKKGGNHIVCLGQDGTKAFILLAALRNRAHELHPKYGSHKTIIVEPDKEHANERQRLISDHTELSIVNLFDKSDRIVDNNLNEKVIIASLDHALKIPSNLVINFIILDHADLLLCKGIKAIKDLVAKFHDKQILTFTCSLIHNNNELTPLDTLKLIRRLESVFNAKCETSSDLRSLSRQSPPIDVETIKCKTSELMVCEKVLLADSLFKEFCSFISDEKLDISKSLIEPDKHVPKERVRTPVLSPAKQLVLVRSCMSDVIYAIHCLGFWCVRRTVKLYLTEFSRLLTSESSSGHLLSAANTILNCFYGRLDELISQCEPHTENNKHIVLLGATNQLKSLLECIKKLRTNVNTSAPICIVHVRKRIIAKVIALWLSEVASVNEEYSFIKPNYVVGSSRMHRNRMSVDNFDLHHETTIRDFRFGYCNVLVTSAIGERCTDIPRCNLVVSFDIPARFSEFIQAKVNCRYDSSRYVIMQNDLIDTDSDERITSFINMEKLLNDEGKRTNQDFDETDLIKSQEPNFPPYPGKFSKNPATIWRSISIINKYCTKLPSDSFTRLSPEWQIHCIDRNSETQYFCMIRLPINSPITARSSIYGPVMPTKNLAMRAAAYIACKVLHESKELDDNMSPITKESMKLIAPLTGPRESRQQRGRASHRGQSIGSTKHRQYYKKRIAKVFSGPQLSCDTKCFLYKIGMALTCPIPDEQNRRGRRVVDPSETNCNYAIVCPSKLPKICSFPVFTRSGEVLISLELVAEDFSLNEEKISDLRAFHEYTFSKVLRLEKYPTVFDPDSSPFTVLLAPVIDDDKSGRTEIDWKFVTKIVNSDQESHVPSVEERKNFTFKFEDYVDAVVIPWYRLIDRQQFAYYVAEICTNLNPKSPFPDESSGFATFVDYYKSKYNIEIYNMEQPVLDVDHTSARLNLLTPRYVNRKGRTLPSSTAKTRRESRESLVQKQLLIPELCSIHPFPASFWRKAVCLPCIFYRLNSLFLAEELRREVAQDTKVGFIEPPADYQWPQLDFGWSLKDVMTNQNPDEEGAEGEEVAEEQSSKSKPAKQKKLTKKSSTTKSKEVPKKKAPSPSTYESNAGESDFVIDHFDPSKVFIPDIPLDAPESEWMNIKLISSSNSGGGSLKGWDQPLEQQDIFLEHTNDLNWSDCEMEFDGEVSEEPGRVRCGSPSSFEPKFFTASHEPNLVRPIQHKSIKFGGDESDMSSDDNDQVSETSKQARAKAGAAALLDSSDEWSLEENDDDDAVESSYDDLKSGFKGEWLDSKVRKQLLLRELFVPVHRVSDNPSSESTDRFYNLMKDYLEHDESDDAISLSGQLEKLKLSSLKAEESKTQLLVDLLNDVFENKISVSEEEIESIVKEWFGMMSTLDDRVAKTLKQEPDLFKDNGIELVAVDDSLGDYNLQVQPTFGELLPNRDVNCDWPHEDWKKIKFDPTIGEIKSNGPGPSVIIQALTMSNASDGINLERLETVGDSFLKYSITAYLYCMYPTMHEGKLSYLRSTEISNANLYQLGRSKNLGELMSATKFEPNDNWLAPGYTVTDSLSEHDSSGNKKREIDKALAEVPYDLLRQHSIPDKSIADCVEALIGAYLTASGSRAALLFMRWLGLKVIPNTFDLDEDVKQYNEQDRDKIWRWLDTPPSPLICTETRFADPSIANCHTIERTDPKCELDCLYYANNLDKFESDIGYSFKDKAYLVQAFTHNSFYENHVTDCHQRLEFLGDALLDYLITRYLFEDPRCHSPGTLTDLRSALVNNTFFASLAVKYKFHKYLKFISDELLHVIDGFVKKFRFDNTNVITKGYTLLINEGESEYAEDIEVPKALGDVFESVAGAIYLDSGMSLDQVWQVYFKMMKPEIEYFSSHVPKSPIRELLESKPQNVRFSPSELAPDRKHRVVAEVFGLGRFTGVGRNKHSAKSTAAKRALRMLAIRGNKQDEDGEEEEEEEADGDNDVQESDAIESEDTHKGSGVE